MKTLFINILMALVALTCSVSQISAQDLNLGSHSDSFHIRHDYVSGEAVTFTISSQMHVTMHTYTADQPIRPHDETSVTASSGIKASISVRDLSSGNMVAQQSGSLDRKYVHDPYQACLVLPELPAGTYAVTVEGDESTLLTMEGFLTSPPHSLDGREAGQPVNVGTFSGEFGYSDICDTSGEGYWAGSGSPSNDVFYRFTITEPMYVVVTHWGTEMLLDLVPSRLSILACDQEGIIQFPPLAEVNDMISDDNLMGNENLVSLLIDPDRIPEIEYNDPLCASWHGMLRPGTYYVLSEGPYTASNSALSFNGPIRTNIRGFIYPGQEARKEIYAGQAQDGSMDFQDSKFFGTAGEDELIYRFSLDTAAKLSVTTDADNLVLKKGDETLSSTAAKTWEQLAAGEYTLSLTATGNRIITTTISSEKYIPPYVPETLDKKNNFVRVLRPFREGSADPDRIDLGNSRQTIDYYDGLGRPVQTVRRREASNGKDLVTHTCYTFGRPVQEWNETAVGTGNAMLPYQSIPNSTAHIYSDDYAFRMTEYENSLLSRPVSVTGPGNDWHMEDKSIDYEYLINSDSGVLSCRKFTVSGAYDEIAVPTCSGSYASGELSVVRTVSEDGVSAYEFTDRKGRLILTRTVKGDEYIDTYFVYDIRNQLRAVITPAASEAVNIDGSLTSSSFDKYCYGYGYDDRGNQVTSKNPGSAPSRTIFNALGHPLFHQTPRQALSGEWSFDIPDIHGRSAIKGIVTIEENILHEMAEADIYAEFYPEDIESGLYAVCNYPFLFDELHQVFYYDNHSFLNEYQPRGEALAYKSSCGPDSRREDEGLTCRGMMTGSLTRDLETGDMRLSAIYYDRYGNITQTVFENNAGGVSVITNTHDFLGNVLTEKESHSLADGTESLLSRIHEYDRAGRLMQTVTDLDGVEVVTRNTYDPVGRLEMTVVSSGEVSDTTLRSYNVRGWQTEIQNDSWSAQMRYNNPQLSGSMASFTGNISEWEWTRGNSTDTYSLEYDALSRIVDSRLFRNGNPVDALSESGISYDSNGNILSLTRTGESGSTINDLAYTYDGNRLTSLSDGDVQSQNYAYDVDGNMTFDGRTGMSLTWNDLGLVKKVSLNDTDLVNYSYLADGTKVSALDGDGDGLLYLGSLIYRKTGSNISLESAGFAGGRFVARETEDDGKTMVPMFHVTDHLGSVRAVVDGVSGEVVEANDYYPFGSRWDVAADLKDDTNRFRYNSKEEQFNFGTPYIDYGARQYDPVLGRWFAQDPLSEKYYSISPYAFCGNNPVAYVDLYGRDTVYVFDQPQRPNDRGIKGETYTGEVYVEIEGKIVGPYRASSYPNSKSNTDNTPSANTINEGITEFNNKFGHDKGQKKGLNIVDENGERLTEGTTPNGEDVTMELVNVHSGYSDKGNYNSRGSHGCVTIHPDDADAFFSNFIWDSGKNTGTSSGKIIIMREENQNKKQLYEIVLNKVRK